VTDHTSDVLDEVFSERERQDVRFPDQHLPNGTSAHLFKDEENLARLVTDQAHEQGDLTWRHVLTEEFYEVCAEEDPVKLRVELIQVAAVATRWVEDLDR
jgi:hypothetical protein